MAKLVGDVDSARNEVDELKRAQADLGTRLAKLEQQLEAVRAECADKIGQVVEATRTARAALDGPRAATRWYWMCRRAARRARPAVRTTGATTARTW